MATVDGWAVAEQQEIEARARAMDDRPLPALENIARDIEAEARPSVEDLMAERYGGRRQGGA